MAGDHGFGVEVEAVASYRWRSLLVGARDHNALTLCWFRTPANFQTCSTPPNECSLNSTSPTLLSRLRQMVFTGLAYRSTQQHRQERPMGAVMVRCPETGRDIPTGLVTDRKSFDATPVFFARVYCPICRSEHEWFAKE